MEKDPLPGIPHGEWKAAFGVGQTGGEAAWSTVEHPVTRGRSLDPSFTQMGVAATAGHDDSFLVLAVLTRPPTATADSRQQVWDALAARWPPGAAPRAAPRLEAALDALAAEVASGRTSIPSALKKVKSVAKDAGLVEGYAAWAFVGATGVLPDLSGVQIDPRMRYLAIGDAAGTGEAGIGTTTLLVVVAPRAN